MEVFADADADGHQGPLVTHRPHPGECVPCVHAGHRAERWSRRNARSPAESEVFALQQNGESRVQIARQLESDLTTVQEAD